MTPIVRIMPNLGLGIKSWNTVQDAEADFQETLLFCGF